MHRCGYGHAQRTFPRRWRDDAGNKNASSQKSPPHPAEVEEPEEPEDSKKTPEAGEPQIVPDAKGKQELRNMVESLVRLVNNLRHNGAIRLPDPLERVFKTIIESMDTLQDDLNTDLDIDLGNLLNSGGK